MHKWRMNYRFISCPQTDHSTKDLTAKKTWDYTSKKSFLSHACIVLQSLIPLLTPHWHRFYNYCNSAGNKTFNEIISVDCDHVKNLFKWHQLEVTALWYPIWHGHHNSNVNHYSILDSLLLPWKALGSTKTKNKRNIFSLLKYLFTKLCSPTKYFPDIILLTLKNKKSELLLKCFDPTLEL